MKPAQENLIKKSGILYTIVHSTQFFEFLGSIVASAAKDKEIHSSPAEIQPITSDDVATAMAHVTLDKPANAAIEIAGPEVYGLARGLPTASRKRRRRNNTVTLYTNEAIRGAASFVFTSLFEPV